MNIQSLRAHATASQARSTSAFPDAADRYVSVAPVVILGVCTPRRPRRPSRRLPVARSALAELARPTALQRGSCVSGRRCRRLRTAPGDRVRPSACPDAPPSRWRWNRDVPERPGDSVRTPNKLPFPQDSAPAWDCPAIGRASGRACPRQRSLDDVEAELASRTHRSEVRQPRPGSTEVTSTCDADAAETTKE